MRKKPRQSAASAAIRRFSDGVSNPLLRIGTGTPNTFGATTYLPQFTTMARQTLEWAYQTSWMCGLVVDIPAEDMTREGIEIKCEDPKASEAIQRAFDRFGVMDQLCDAIKWARLYGGAIAVILIDAADDGPARQFPRTIRLRPLAARLAKSGPRAGARKRLRQS